MNLNLVVFESEKLAYEIYGSINFQQICVLLIQKTAINPHRILTVSAFILR